MTRWIEEHADVLLRLIPGHRRAQSDRVGDGGGPVIYCDVEVHHHLLVAAGGRPDRGHIVRRGLERQVRRGAWYDEVPGTAMAASPGSCLAIGQPRRRA